MNLLLSTLGPSGHPIYNKPMGFTPFLVGGIILGCILLYIHTPHPHLSKKDKIDLLIGWFWVIVSLLFVFGWIQLLINLFKKDK